MGGVGMIRGALYSQLLATFRARAHIPEAPFQEGRTAMLEKFIDVIFGAQTVAHLRDLLARKAASSLADKMYTLRHLQKPLDDAHLTELVHRTVAQLQSESKWEASSKASRLVGSAICRTCRSFCIRRAFRSAVRNRRPKEISCRPRDTRAIRLCSYQKENRYGEA